MKKKKITKFNWIKKKKKNLEIGSDRQALRCLLIYVLPQHFC